MKSVTLEAFPRSVKKRNAVKKLRAEGRVPGVLYGSELESLDVEIDVKKFEDLVKNATSEVLLVERPNVLGRARDALAASGSAPVADACGMAGGALKRGGGAAEFYETTFAK